MAISTFLAEGLQKNFALLLQTSKPKLLRHFTKVLFMT
jgi:hypothetical protein